MNCPKCCGTTSVLETRADEESVKRRRKCLECNHRFYTIEIDADMYEQSKPIDKAAVQNALLDGYTELTRQIYRALNIQQQGKA